MKGNHYKEIDVECLTENTARLAGTLNCLDPAGRLNDQ